MDRVGSERLVCKVVVGSGGGGEVGRVEGKRGLSGKGRVD